MTLPSEPTLREQKLKTRQSVVSTNLRVGVSLVAVLFGALYVFQANAFAGRGYEMSNLQRKIADLQSEDQRIQVQIATYRSMKSIEERMQGMSFEPAGTVSYVHLEGGTVASR